MEAAKHQQLLLESQHPVATPGRGASTRSHLLPPLGREVEAPEVLVVVELGLGGAAGETKPVLCTVHVYSVSPCELAPEHPELTTGLADHTGLVGGARGRAPGGDNPRPL